MFIKNEFFVDVGLLVLRIHLLPLVHKQHVLDLLWVEVDLAPEGVRVASITLEEDH